MRNIDISAITVRQDRQDNIVLNWTEQGETYVIPYEIRMSYPEAERLQNDLFIATIQMRNRCVLCKRVMSAGGQVSSIEHPGRMQHHPNCEYYQ